MLYWICLVALIDITFICQIKSELDKEALPNWINDGPPKEVTAADESKTSLDDDDDNDSNEGDLKIAENLTDSGINESMDHSVEERNL